MSTYLHRMLFVTAVSAPAPALAEACAGLLAALQGCGADPGAAETQQLRRELRPIRCGLSAELAQVRARDAHYRGADAFDSRGCPPGVADQKGME